MGDGAARGAVLVVHEDKPASMAQATVVSSNTSGTARQHRPQNPAAKPYAAGRLGGARCRRRAVQGERADFEAAKLAARKRDFTL
jgi:hypothetical protein